MSAVACREMKRGDLDAVWPLLEQLGYEITREQLEARFEMIWAASDHLLLVAEQGDRVAGFLHASVRPALEKPPEPVVQAMAVDKSARRAGIGGALMAAAESWARDGGFSSISLYSQVERSDAHAFYTRLGFRPVATSALLRKALGDSSG